MFFLSRLLRFYRSGFLPLRNTYICSILWIANKFEYFNLSRDEFYLYLIHIQ